MIPQLRLCQRQHRRREEHGLIVRMRDQQTYALVPEFGEARTRHGDGVEPAGDDENGERGEGEPLHIVGVPM